MARGGKIANKHKPRSKVRLEKMGSDESDEDYMVGEDEEFVESEDEYCSSLADYETEESLREFEEDELEDLEEEWESKKTKNVGKPIGKRNFRRKNNGVVTAYREVEREDYEIDDSPGTGRMQRKRKNNNDIGSFYRQEEDDLVDEKPRKRTRVLPAEEEDGKPRKKTKVSYQEDGEDGDYDDFDDEEFTPDDLDDVDDDEDLPVTKKNKVDTLRVKEAPIVSGNKRRTNAKALKRRKRNKPIKKQVSRRSQSHGIVQRKKKTTEKGRGRRKSTAKSDSDFVNSGSSDYEYTISEEEREQIKEASELCRRLASSSRSSSSLKMIEEEETVPLQRKGQIRKGKDKMLEMKTEVGKQVCGICLSEEGKRTVRGILNCCSHYFCFACIMEWSKVESRCPLCKQRFATINRTSREDGGHDLRDAVITVPERDQVYQPSEEELRGYFDPYENVLCTECHQGGDDAFMLLCDLCDSPAHTYCVGLGREVPEGNWYCDSCRPTALASTNAAQFLNPTPAYGGDNNFSVGASPVGITRETFDLNELYIPETPLTPSTQANNGHSSSPRNPVGDFQVTSPSSGFGAFTLFERRRIQRQIHQLLNDRSRQAGVGPVSGINLLGSQMTPQHAAVPVRVTPQNVYSTPSLYGRQVLSPRLSSLREQVLHHQASTSRDQSFSGNNPDAFREVGLSSLEKEQVQSMVRSHLKILSRNSDLGYITFKNIARASTHTILAAFGLQHRQNEVRPVRTRPLFCDHLDKLASQNTCPIAGQCLSCFDWFVGNVVKEIMSSRVPL